MSQNYNLSFGLNRLSGYAGGKVNNFHAEKKSQGLHFKLKFMLSLMAILLFAKAEAQVANYTFAQTSGTYTEITGGTQLVTTTGGSTSYDTDGSNFSLPAASQFVFSGTTVTSVTMQADGSLWLNPGSSTTGNGVTGPLASSATAAGIISVMGMDLRSTALSGQVYERRWQDVGTEVVFQWKNAARFGQSSNERFSFQVRVNKSSGVINMVYSTMTTIANSTTYQPVVGLRGSANTIYKSRNLTTSIPDATPSWDDTAASTSNSQTVRFTNTVFPNSGQTFTWSPPVDPYLSAGTLTAFGNVCINTTAGPNNFTLSGSNLTSADVTIAASPGYTYSTTSGGTYTSTLTLTPSGGSLNQTVYVKFTPTAVQAYTTNISISGGGASSAATVTPSGSGVNTTPTESVSSATVGSVTLTGATISGATISALGCSNVTAYGIEYSTTSGFTGGTGTQVAGTGFSGVAGGTFSATLSGLTSGTTYYYRAYATNAGGTSYSSTTASFSTLTVNQIGTGTGTNSIMPVYPYYGYSYSQQIILASEMTAVVTAGQTYITKIRYKPSGLQTPQANYNNWTIYMGNTSKAAFTATDWVATSAMSTVFSGVIPTMTNNTWVEITLTTPFLWDGTSNIVIGVDENAASYADNTGNLWASYNGTTNRGIYFYDDTTNPNPASPPTSGGTGFSTTSTLAQIQFVTTLPPNCLPVTGVSASATSYNSGTASWMAPSTGDVATGYEWEVRTSGAAGSGSPIATGTPTGTSATITGLTPNTTYSFYVRTNCGGTYSTWSAAQTFTTQPITAIASGDFAAGSNWNNGTGPVCGQMAVIPNGMAMTVTSGSASTGSLTINSGGSLTISGGALTVGCTGNNNALSNSGTLTISGGTLTINGNIVNANGSTFAQSNGNIIIDGNDNFNTATSVASGTPLFGFGTSSVTFSTGAINLTGGTLTIVDPHTAGTNTSAYALYANLGSSVSANASAAHTIKFGDGVSTQQGGNSSGFYWNGYAGSGRLNLGTVIVNNPSGTNRVVTQTGTNAINGNLTVTAGTFSQGTSTTNIGGNVLVENAGIFLTGGTTVFATTTGTTTGSQTVAQSVSVTGSGLIQNLASAPTANFASLTTNNTSTTGVTINSLNQIIANSSIVANILTTLTFNGKISTPAGKGLLGGTATTPATTITINSGGMVPGSGFARGWNATAGGTAITAGSQPNLTANNFHPFIDANGNGRYVWIERVTPSAAGILMVTYNDVAAADLDPGITESSYTVNKRSAGKWTVSAVGTSIAAATYKIAMTAPAIFGATPSSTEVRVMTESAFIGTHQAGLATPHAQRAGLTLAQLTGQDFYMGINNSDIPFYSIQNGNWENGTTWNKGVAPTVADNVTISTGTTVTANTAAVTAGITINAGGVLEVSSNTLAVTNTITNTGTFNINGGTVNIGANLINSSTGSVSVAGGILNVTSTATNGINNAGTFTLSTGTVNVGPTNNTFADRRFTNTGTLTVSGGTLNIYGNLAHSGTAFNQSGGNINIDPNAGGVAANSAASTSYTLNLTAAVNWTGGTLTLVDPPASTSTTHYSLYYSVTPSSEVATAHTLRFGNNISSDAGGNAIGYLLYNYISSGKLNFGTVEINGPATGTASATNRMVKQISWSQGIRGDLTIQNKGEFQLNAIALSVGGNINVAANSKLIADATLTLAAPSGTTTVASTVAQSITNNGTIENIAGAGTANFSALTINNTNATGITLNSPLSISGTLTLTAGKVNTTDVNLLSLGTATAAGTLSGGSSTAYINGPFARTFASSRTASGTYSALTLLPVGKGTAYLPAYIDPTTSASGPVVFKGEAFTTNTGTQGVGVTSLSSNRWEVIPTSNANLTNAFVRLGDASITSSSKIIQAPAANGEYGGISSAVTYTSGTPNVITTSNALPVAEYTGYFAYGELNSCIAPVAQSASLTASSKTSTSYTVNYASVASASHYLVVRYTGTFTPVTPTDYTTYSGTALGGTVVYNGPLLTFNQTGLTPGTTYTYYVYTYNNSGCYGPVYNAISPLVQAITTCASNTGAPGTPTATATATSITPSWTASSTSGVDYILEVATNSGFTSYISGYNNVNIGSVLTTTISGLAANTTYYVRVRAIQGDCISAVSSTLTVKTLCNAITSLPHAEGFDAATLPSCWSATTTATETWAPDNANDGVPAPRTGDRFAGLTWDGSTTESILISPPYNLTANQRNTRLSVWIYRNASNGLASDKVTFYVNNSQSTSGATTLIEVSLKASEAPAETTSGWYNYTAAIPSSFISGGNFYIIAKGNVQSSSSSYSVGFDDYSLEYTPATITSFNPTTVCSSGGETVTITGTNFAGATGVKFNGVDAANFTVVNATTITAVTPSGVATGNISVVGHVNTATSSTALTVTATPVVQDITGGNTAVCSGSSVQLVSSASAGTGIWTSSNEAVAHVDLNTGLVTAISAGTATITFTATNGSCIAFKTTSITVNDIINITSFTSAQTITPGDSTQFSVVATGTGLSYQWYVSTNGGTTYIPISNGGAYSGVTSSILSINSIDETFNGYLYHVVITGTAPCSPVTSDDAILAVSDISITTQPESVTLCGSGNAEFTVVAEGSGLTYKWYENQGSGAQLITNGTVGGITYSGANTATLSITNAGVANNGWTYYVVVSDAAMAEAISGVVTLTVNTPPQVNTNPSNSEVCYTGGTTSYTVAASGTGLSYQWQYAAAETGPWANVTDAMPAGINYSGAVTATLTVTTTAATPISTYYYRAVVNGTAPCTTATSTAATLTFFTPQITSQPAAAGVTVGQSTTFTVATSAPSPTYQWQYATSASGPWSNVTAATPAGTTYSGDTSATLTVNANTTTGGSYNYRAVVTSGGCSVNSNSAQLTVTDYCATTFTNAATNDYVTAMTITATTFSSTPAQVTTAPYYSFLTGGTNTTTLYAGSTYTANLTVGSAASQNTGIWIDFNSDGDFSDTGEFVGSATIAASGSGTISIAVPAGTTLGSKRMRVRNTRTTTIVAGSACGNLARGNTVDYVIAIATAPDCTGTPATASVTANTSNFCLSGSATLTATNLPAYVSGITMQWYNSAGAISGATSATYTTPTLSASETYYLRVTCSASGQFSDSNNVTITINTPLVASTTPGERCGTGTVTLGATGSAGTTLSWYAAATGGTVLNTGTSFITPSISTTTPYYVEATQIGSSASAGPANYLAVTGTKSTFAPSSSNYMIFSATSTARISSVTVYASVAGQLNLQLANSSGVVLQTYNYTITSAEANSTATALGTPIIIPVNFNVPVGTNLRLGIATGTTATLLRNESGAASYYNVATNGVTFTSNSLASTAYWYFFYNINIASACTSSRTLVNATVNSGPSLTLSTSAVTICNGTASSAVTLTAGGSDYDTYQWSPSTGVSGNAVTGWTFNPSVTTAYTLTASQSGGAQCNRTATVAVSVNTAPTALTVTPETATVCSGEAAVQLTATGGLVSNSYTLGTQTSTSSIAGVTPFTSNWEGARVQYLVKASELTAMGITAGEIKSLAFNVTASGAGTTPQTNYTIKIGKTNATTIGSGYAALVGSFTTVFTAASVPAPSVGDRLFTFSTPYTWDGTSNIVIDICHDNDTAGTCTNCYSSNSTVGVMTTSFNSVYSTYADNAQGCGSTSGGSFTSYTTRPIMKFGADAQGTVIWTPTTGLYTNASATVAYTGGNAAIVYAKPTGTTTYTATSTAGSGCVVTDTATVTITSKTWTGAVSANWNTAGNWCGNAVPAITDNVVVPNVANKPIISGNIVALANTLTIESGAVVTVSSGNSLTVKGAMNLANANSLVVENYASLKQEDNVANTGAGSALVHRNSSKLFRNDFTLWSSPVADQKLFQFSPNTLATRFYGYNQASDNFVAVPNLGPASTTTFATAASYLIRMPDAQKVGGVPTGTFVPAALGAPGQDYNAGVQRMIFNGVYNGMPNNGTITFNAATSFNGYNAIGNPYPSPISISSFFAANENNTDGTIYVWRKKNGAEASAYCTMTADGEFTSNLQPEAENPNGVLQVGQGFIVKASGPIVFNNSMRQTLTAVDSSFFRSPSAEVHRIRLNLYKGSQPMAQMLVSYKTNATMGADLGIDALFINDAATALNSVIGTTAYAIQGRALPFSSQDVVPLQFKAGAAGSYTISLAQFDGLFAGDQNIFLKDKLLNITHNIKAGTYTFSSEQGTFDNRFELLYTDAALGTDNPVLDPNSIVIWKSDNKLHIDSGVAIMKDIRIFDIRGRLVYEKTGVNATTAEVTGLSVQEEMLIVQVTTTDNAKVSKKVIY
jgi:hypothetical protein